MIKEKQRDKGKNGASGGKGYENIATPTSSGSENRDDSKKELGEKGPDVKEEPEEAETQDNLSATHNSPLEESKSSPSQQNDIIPSSLPCKGVKSENGESTDNFRNDSCENVLRVNMTPDNIHEGVQPLPSNVVNKQPVTMEAQYMQQQSQIFVFSTALANKAADAVMQGHFQSIIAYHCSQPRPKSFMDNNNQQNTMMANQCNKNMNVDHGAGKNNLNAHSNMMQSHSGPMMPDQGMISALGDLNQDIGLSAPQLLAGVKVPDENLTPQQRQHREEQLATLRKMQQILFPEALQGPDEAGHIDNPLPENMDMNKTSTGQNDWQKLQMQFYEDPKSKKPRTSGPPPSYQQATRSASVPIALQSPNPSSPNNTTSNLSLPSPRTCSGINSPADKVSSRMPGPSPTMESPNPARSANSNPPTPVSSHLSPKHKDKIGNNPNEFSPSSTVSAQNSQQSPVDSIYCRSVQSMGQQKQGSSSTGKEPNLMPVPSPQQIQYLNTFEGQELTIQKQPNTSLKESDNKNNPTMPPTSLESVTPPVPNSNASNELVGKRTESPTSTTPDMPSRSFSSDNPSSDGSGNDKNAQVQRKIDPSFCNSPQNVNDRCQMNMGPNNFVQKCPGYMDSPNPKMNANDKDMPGVNYPCMGPDNVPLNPNRITAPAPNKSSHFDPISSLAQMSQQLTNAVPNSPVNQPNLMPNMHNNLVPFNPPSSSQHLMSMADLHHMPNPPPDHRMQGQMPSHFNSNRAQCSSALSPGMPGSPKMMPGYGVGPRPMPRPMGYNGANVTVKQGGPNTIQYLPSRPQPQPSACPRGPPSLDFLQRFSNPLSNLDAKVPTHNLQYFPNNYPQNNMNDMGMCSPQGNIRGPPIRNPNPGMMRLQGPQMQPMGFNNNEGFQNANCQMFGPGKASGMGLAPDATQPLPPSMGQSNNFKNSTFIGPTTADPNYAQQFHNFQQQLYATNTRGQLSAQAMGGNSHYFVPK